MPTEPPTSTARRRSPAARGCIVITATLLIGAGVGAATPPDGHDASAPPTRVASGREPVVAKPKLDLSGRKRVGKASFYAKSFVGRKMADGTRMDPKRDNAASKTLPLGTVAKVTNLATGQSAVVTIKDRGPYYAGRIVDLTPATAEKVGITPQQGVAAVEVAPIAVPLPDGSIKTGVAAQSPSAALAAMGEAGANAARAESSALALPRMP